MCGEASGVDEVTTGAFVSLAIDTPIIGFLKGSRHGKRENKKVARHLEILESVLGEDVYGWVVLREEHHLGCIYPGTLEYVNQPVAGIVSGMLQIPIQYRPSLYVQ